MKKHITAHGGQRSNAGRPNKVSKGQHTAKRLCITIPWELWQQIDAKRLPKESTSGLIQRLLSTES